jgi:F-type H+-transporting ATPase subunit epsilon
MSRLRLLVTTPMEIVLDRDDAEHVRAEDETGAFGILRGHADFLTVLVNSLITWRDTAGAEHYVAVRGGILSVRDGETVEVATREALTGDDLAVLEQAVLTRFHEETGVEETSRAEARRLQLAAIRQICRYLRPQPGLARFPGPPGAMTESDPS